MSIDKTPSNRPSRKDDFSSGKVPDGKLSEIVQLALGPRKKRKVKITKSDVSIISESMAEIAGSIGQTSNEDDFAQDMADVVFDSLKNVEKRQSDDVG